MMPEQTELSAVRRHGVRLIVWGTWAAATAFLLVAGNAGLGLLERWVRALETLRRTFGFVPPAGPDWFLTAGVLLALAAPCALAVIVYGRYRAAWRRRLKQVWSSPGDLRRYSRPWLPGPEAGERETAARLEWLKALAGTPAWQGRVAVPATEAAEPTAEYRRAAAQFLAAIEDDVAQRATLTGLVVGIGRSRALDLATIAFGALELQLHVLAALGKRPSPKMWSTLCRNTAASLFVNTYLNREETCALTLAIRKVGLGLEAAAGAADEVAEALAEMVGDTAAEAGGLVSLAGPVVSVGTSGVRQVGRMVDRYAEELLQGILAGGILYYHGMSIAADCLALDESHRESPEMRRGVREAAGKVCLQAAAMVRAQARELRAAIRGRVRRPAAAAAQAAVAAPARAWGRLRRGFNRRPDTEKK